MNPNLTDQEKRYLYRKESFYQATVFLPSSLAISATSTCTKLNDGKTLIIDVEAKQTCSFQDLIFCDLAIVIQKGTVEVIKNRYGPCSVSGKS